MSNRVINRKEISWEESSNGQKYSKKRKRIGQALGTKDLGVSLFEIPPGKRAFPYHFHHANEELFYVLSGEGTLRGPAGEEPVAPGDFIRALACRDGAHQIFNTSDEPLQFLAVSTMREPDVVEYPDSEKIFVASGAAPGGEESRRTLDDVWRLQDTVDYWLDET